MGQPSVGTGLVRAAAVVAGLTLVARVVGFGRWLVFSKTVGDTCLGDVYTAANQLPNVLFEVVAGGVLAGVVVPVVARQVGAGDRVAAGRTTSALLSWAILLLTPAGLLVLLVAPVYGRVFVTPACAGGVDVAASLLVIFAPQVWLYGLAVVSAGVLQAHHRFVAAAVAPLVSSVVVIVAYLLAGAAVSAGPGQAARADVRLTPVAAIQVLGWGTTAGVLALAVTTTVIMVRLGLRLRPTLRFDRDTGSVVRRIAVGSLIGLVAQQGAVLLMTWVARESAEPGAVTRLTWATAIYLLPYAVLAAPLIQTVFPRMSVAAGESESAGEDLLRRYGPPLIVLSATGAAVLAVTAGPVARVFVLGPGSGDTAALGWPLLVLAPAVAGYALMIFANRALLAAHAARSAAVVTVVAWLVAAAGALTARLLPSGWVVTGIGAAVSVGMVVGAGVGWAMVRRRRVGGGWAWRRPLAAGLSAVVVCAALGVVVVPLFGSTGLVAALGGALAGALIGVVVSLLLVRLVAPTAYAQARAVLTRRR